MYLVQLWFFVNAPQGNTVNFPIERATKRRAAGAAEKQSETVLSDKGCQSFLAGNPLKITRVDSRIVGGL
jgi:hypothetical protein